VVESLKLLRRRLRRGLRSLRSNTRAKWGGRKSRDSQANIMKLSDGLILALSAGGAEKFKDIEYKELIVITPACRL